MTRDRQSGLDPVYLKLARITNSSFTQTTKSLELQSLGRKDDAGNADSVYSPHFGEWCLIAPPLAPDADASGNISNAAEGLFAEYGDDNIGVGTRDVRASKFAQDALGGEVVLTNTDGFRLALKHKTVSLIAGGGFLTFDLTKKTVGLAGIPSAPGKSVPYLVIDSSSIGLVSETGAASVSVHGNQVSLSGGACGLDFGGVTIGKGAADAVVLQSLLASVLLVIQTTYNTHTHSGGTLSGITGPPAAQLAISGMVTGSLRVKSA